MVRPALTGKSTICGTGFSREGDLVHTADFAEAMVPSSRLKPVPQWNAAADVPAPSRASALLHWVRAAVGANAWVAGRRRQQAGSYSVHVRRAQSVSGQALIKYTGWPGNTDLKPSQDQL